MELTERIAATIGPGLAAMGYEIVRIRLGGSGRPTLQVMCDRLDGGALTLDDCTGISRLVSATLDVEDPIAGAYSLEVSSPGLDRPLTRPKDFARFAGAGARLELKAPVEGRKRFSGVLRGLDGDAVVLEAGEGTHRFALADIDRARLVPDAGPEARTNA